MNSVWVEKDTGSVDDSLVKFLDLKELITWRKSRSAWHSSQSFAKSENSLSQKKQTVWQPLVCVLTSEAHLNQQRTIAPGENMDFLLEMEVCKTIGKNAYPSPKKGRSFTMV